jgi:tRNA threonylcarbamoyladenosine biosynthesis protein TsaB
LISLARGGRWPACPPDAAELCYVRDKVALKTHERLAAA